MEVIAQSKKYNPDRLATYLINLVQKAHLFPAGVGRLPIYTPEGILGQLIPGKGISINFDLNTFGITKSIPGVYEKSYVDRLLDITRHTLHSNKGVVSTMSELTAIVAAQNVRSLTYLKTAIAGGSNLWSSAFTSSLGSVIGGTYSNIPGGASYNKSSDGAYPGLINPQAPNYKYILSVGFGCTNTNINMYMLVDLLVAAGNISATSTSAQTVNSTALTRYTDGAGVMMTFDVTSALGATPSDITTTYTNQGGTGSRSTGAIALTPSAVATLLAPDVYGPFVPLQAGDYGVRSVETVQLSADMGSGTLALNLFKPLLLLPGIASTQYYDINLPDTLIGAVQLATEAGGALGCLTWYLNTSSGSASNVYTLLTTIDF